MIKKGKTEDKPKNIFNKISFLKGKPNQKTSNKNLISWEFIIDHNGNYLNISPEVTECLGIPSQDFLDQSVFSFSINLSSGEKLQDLFLANSFPIEQDVIFIGKEGDLFFCNLKLTKFSEEYHSKPTYIGFVQTVDSYEDQDLNSSPAITKPDDYSEKINEKLNDPLPTENVENNNFFVFNQQPDPNLDDNQLLTKISQDLEDYSREINHLIDPIDIYQETHLTINKFVPNKNLIFGILQKQNSEIITPIFKVNDEISYYPNSHEYLPIINQIITSNEVLSQVEQLKPDSINVVETTKAITPKSIIGVPIRSGQKVFGAILVYDHQKKKSFSNKSKEYLLAISTKMANALENAFLFQEMQNALSAIEIREQYQILISQAIKNINIHGSSKLKESLELIGKAANIHRISFAKSNFGNNVKTWTIQTEWYSQEKYNPFHLSKEIKFEVFNDLFSTFSEKGYLHANNEKLDQSIDKWMDNREAQSLLVLPVQTKLEYPDLILLEDLHQKHFWNTDEIRFLELVSATISSSLTNEETIHQINAKLSDIEKTSVIKERISQALMPEDLLHSLMEFFFPKEIFEGFLFKNVTDSSSDQSQFELIAKVFRESDKSNSQASELLDQSIINFLCQQEIPTYFSNFQEANLPKKILALFAEKDFQSFAILPLKIKRKKIGSIAFFSNKVFDFTKNEQGLIKDLLPILTTKLDKFINQDKPAIDQEETVISYKNNSLLRINNLTDLVLFLSENIHRTSNSQNALFIVENSNTSTTTQPYNVLPDYSVCEIESLLAQWGTPEFNDLIADLLNLNVGEFVINQTPALNNHTRQSLTDFTIKSGFFFPIQNREGVIAHLVLLSNQELIFSNELKTLFLDSLDLISLLLDNRNLSKELSVLTRKYDKFLEIIRETATNLDPDSLLLDLVLKIKSKFSFLDVNILTFTNDNDQINKVISASDGKIITGLEFLKLDEYTTNLALDVYKNGQTVIQQNSQTKKLTPLNLSHLKPKSQIFLPIKLDTEIKGVLAIYSNRQNDFALKDIHFFEMLADQIAIEIDNAISFTQSKTPKEKKPELDQIKSQFLANMSHEFRTPLNSIIGFSKVILTGIDGPINETQKQDLTAIHNAGQYLLRLVNDILDITKIDAGTMKLNISKTKIPNLLYSLLPACRNLVTDKVIDFEIDIKEDIPELMIDKDRISQVVMNLASNAVKFTDFGKITISASVKNGNNQVKEVMITVSDTGIGIQPADQEKLFKPFEQPSALEKSRIFGTGLGLALSKSIMTLHQGRIGLLESTPGVGSTFFIALPVEN